MIVRSRVLRTALMAALLGSAAGARAQSSPSGAGLPIRPTGNPLSAAPAPAPPPAPRPLSNGDVLPKASNDPLSADRSHDPILGLVDRVAPPERFKSLIGAAVARAPAITEAEASQEEALYARGEARAALRPSLDLSATYYRTVARDFANDPFNIIERSRPTHRTDLLLSAQQTLLDFGSGSKRIHAASDRLLAAAANIDSQADQIALRTVAAWYDVFTFRALVILGDAFHASQDDLRTSVQERIKGGVSAEGDLPRVDNYIALADSRLARYRRSLANAEARFRELTGTDAPDALLRAPIVGVVPKSRDMAVYAARQTPVVKAAEAQAAAAAQDARAARSDLLPQITVGVDAGRYGVIENSGDFDVRGRVTVRQRLFGGISDRAGQASAQARGAQARADRTLEESARDAAIAFSDVQSLEEAQQALAASYVSSRQSRDVIAERFRVSRGTLFDLLSAEDSYFETAANYVETLGELDAARYALLSKTGRLLGALDIPLAIQEPRRR